MTAEVVKLEYLLDDLVLLQNFMSRHGFEATPVRVGLVEGKFSLLSGDDAVRPPDTDGYWSEVATLTTETSVRELALRLKKQVSESYALQTSHWGDGTGVFVISSERLRMAN